MLFDEDNFPFLAPFLVFAVHLYYKIVKCAYFLINLFVPRNVVPLPAPEDEHLIFCSATDLAEKIRQGEVSATDLLETYVRRAEAVNEIVNAIVEKNYDDARRAAKEVDEYLKQLDKDSDEFKQLPVTKPILGIPFSVKDHIHVKGMKTTVGMPCFKDLPPNEESAVLIKNLRNAGGIPFVVTNVPEGIMWLETVNTVYGRTVNPYDSRRSAGGSSGGEASLLGGAGTVFAIGSDIAGSIRAPANKNGVVGLKPAPNVVDLTGFVPEKVGEAQAEMVGVGPLCRYAVDLNMLFKIFIGPEQTKRLRLNEPVDLSSLRFYSMPGTKNNIASPSLSSDVLDAFNKAIECFESRLNTNVIPVDFPLAKYALNYWFERFTDGDYLPISHFFTGFTRDKRLEVFPELRKWLVGESQHITAVLMACLLEELTSMFNFKMDRKKVAEMREKFKQQLLNLLGDNGILIWPSLPQSGYFHNELLWECFSAEYMTIWNSLALPAIACPMGLNNFNIPTGIQLVCAPGNERLLIAAAEELERAGFKWTHPRA
ncbi:hypothetical protein M3Y97_00536000 [Aphelenchoides bicaudatus]|nr:hypothetical protein M3Y97_00536000 [Aphelenchoides bicaudatus]